MPATTLHLSDRDVALSRVEKELFPSDGFTKGDVIDYYRAVADVMVPHLAGRPLVLHRYPDGVEADGFIQQEASRHFPDWLTLAKAPRREGSGTVDHVVCGDAATLVYLANQATIEYHTWLSTTRDLNCPDRLVVDIDPPPGIEVDTLRGIARRVRDLFSSVGLTPFVQATGGRGFHVVAALDGSRDFEFVRDLAMGMADHLAERDPDLLTTAPRKERRGRRVYLDVNRNAYGQTFVAPYSLRARRGAPIATPLDWSELGRATPDRYHPRAIRRRLARKADPWAAIREHAAAPADVRRRVDALG
jgi:bifunctional non-homologous end joining protein LigD